MNLYRGEVWEHANGDQRLIEAVGAGPGSGSGASVWWKPPGAVGQPIKTRIRDFSKWAENATRRTP